MQLNELTDALSLHLPNVLRWCGAVAKRMRSFDIGIEGKSSGSANTDALTLADLSVQELIVSALRDSDPIFQDCHIEAEESTGDLHRFAESAPYTISIDPIDGTKAYRDRTGNGYACMLLVYDDQTVHYSLIFLPELGPTGTWVHSVDERIVCGADDRSRPAHEVLQSMEPIDPSSRPRSNKIYLIGFQSECQEKSEAVTAAGLQGVSPDEMPGNIFPLFAAGEFGGSLIHTPNVYDFPASLHMARILGGDAVWVHNREPVHFREFWIDERADMLRLPGIIACSDNRETLDILCNVARDWDLVRYRD